MQMLTQQSQSAQPLQAFAKASAALHGKTAGMKQAQAAASDGCVKIAQYPLEAAQAPRA